MRGEKDFCYVINKSVQFSSYKMVSHQCEYSQFDIFLVFDDHFLLNSILKLKFLLNSKHEIFGICLRTF